eukprot:scaffold19758_cov71-Phaeocystis_antarctica.AAC.1
MVVWLTYFQFSSGSTPSWGSSTIAALSLPLAYIPDPPDAAVEEQRQRRGDGIPQVTHEQRRRLQPLPAAAHRERARRRRSADVGVARGKQERQRQRQRR